MKKTVWATGLLVAIVATETFCNSESDVSDDQGYRNSSLTSMLMKAHNGYQLQQKDLVNNPAKLDIKENLQSRFIFECIYHDRAEADGGVTTRKVMVIGSDSCGFSDTVSENVNEKMNRIKGYVTSHQNTLVYYLNQFGLEIFGKSDGEKAVPDLYDPEQVICYQLYSDGEDRQRPVSDYISVVDEIYGKGGKVLPLSDDQETSARNTLYKELSSTATFTEQEYNGQTCHLALISENEYGQHSAGRSCKQNMLLLVKPVVNLAELGWGLAKGSLQNGVVYAFSLPFLGLATTSVPVRSIAGWAWDAATYPVIKYRGVNYTPLDFAVGLLLTKLALKVTGR